MHRFGLLLLVPIFALFPLLSTGQNTQSLNGRWDLTVQTPQETYPSWIEIEAGSGTPQVRVQGKVSSVHPVEDLKIEGSKISFQSSEWFDGFKKVTWQLALQNGKLSGMQKRQDGVEGKITGVRAPLLQRDPPKSWGASQPLFNGKDLTGWRPDNAATNHWQAQSGELVNVSPGANLVTTHKFNDFKLHIEYNCPQDGNSGIYLRGRYELQVAYEPPGKNDKFHAMGSIYGFLAPSVSLPDKPGQWESFDITLVGRHVTVVRDGTTTIDNQEIPGITGGALDSREAEPNSLYIQGDHTGGMKYRNITVSLPGRS
jgi:hypothetical protein